MTDPSSSSEDNTTLSIIYKSRPEIFVLPHDATLSDLSSEISSRLSVPPSNQKLLVSRLGTLKAPFSSSSNPPLSFLANKKITLIGATAEAVASLQHTAIVAQRRQENRATALLHRHAHPSSPRNNFSASAKAEQYTFLSIRPLSYLPDPPASQRYLERLAADPAVRQAMRTHKFVVGLLTEMNPAAHTEISHEGVGRTLGLNRNRGEVIELRLRTDAGDGYRDYKGVRKTLCHELAHNIHSAHDAKFWKLCREIEREIESYERGNRILEESDGPSGPISEEEEHLDHGGWTGGEFVLGDLGVHGNNTSNSNGGLSRREIIAQAAEKRQRLLQRGKRGADEKS